MTVMDVLHIKQGGCQSYWKPYLLGVLLTRVLCLWGGVTIVIGSTIKKWFRGGFGGTRVRFLIAEEHLWYTKRGLDFVESKIELVKEGSRGNERTFWSRWEGKKKKTNFLEKLHFERPKYNITWDHKNITKDSKVWIIGDMTDKLSEGRVIVQCWRRQFVNKVNSIGESFAPK